MIFSGTLIEDLIATVERAERLREVSFRSAAIAMKMTMTVTTTSDETPLEDALPGVEPSPIELWLNSAEQNTNHDTKLLGVA